MNLKKYDFDLLKGGSPSDNARALKDLLDGSDSAYREAVLLNSAAALLIAGSVSSLKDGVTIARESIDTGKAKEKASSLAKITSGK